ncbi:MAG: hypothetical protein KJZ79_21290 [Bryobacteraceae bacterium]|nr:hypothetical protein [Bryobacteraceae bacterium]
MDQGIPSILSQTLSSLSPREALQLAAALLAALGTLLLLRHRPRRDRLLARWDTLTRHWVPVAALALILPLALRLALLPFCPPPEPVYHDEFTHLLVGDTLAAGRLANPPHPLRAHFETIYVLQQPTYSAAYPIGQGLFLAAGELLFGHPWAGVLLSVALMSAAIVWMLYALLPPGWAAAAGFTAAFHFGAAHLWIDSYWGGAVGALGGALVFGALGRLRHGPSPRLALLLGAGWSLVWLVRPFESVWLLLAASAVLVAFIWRDRPFWRTWIASVTLFLAPLAFTALLSLSHNHAVTGSPLTLPYQLLQRHYGVPQGLAWQQVIPQPPLQTPEQETMYLWQVDAKNAAIQQPGTHFQNILKRIQGFYLPYWWLLPFAVAFALPGDPAARFATAIPVLALLAALLYPFFFPHYIAACACLFIFLIFQGFAVVSRWSWRGWPAGAAFAVFLATAGLLPTLRWIPINDLAALRPDPPTRRLRSQVASHLLAESGRHVVVIRYDPTHPVTDEWLYNAANIDEAPIVWCRPAGPDGFAELRRYYPDRRFWFVDIGARCARLAPLSSDDPASVVEFLAPASPAKSIVHIQ